MSNHLPECPCNHADERGCFLICICPQLRACEQRVEKEWTRDWDEALSLIKRIDVSTIRMKALREAREAVAAVGVRKDTSHDMRVQALAAIDALRGSGNPHTPPSAEKGEQA